MALGRGGALSTSEVTPALQTAASVAVSFGIAVRVFGRMGGPGGIEVERV